MEKTKIKLSLDIGIIDKRSMSLKIFDGDNLIFNKNSFDSSKEHVEFEVNLPTSLKLFTDGKNLNDTIIGSDQSIISDMYVKISKMSIDNMPIKTWILEKCFFSGDSISGKTFSTNYIGYNGITKVEINYENSFDFLLDTMSKG